MHKIKTTKGWYLMSKKNRRIKGPADEKTIDRVLRQIKIRQEKKLKTKIKMIETHLEIENPYRKFHPKRVRK